MTEPTKELIDLNYSDINNFKSEVLDYHQKIKLKDNKTLQLLPADHVLGTAQILFENTYRILYSSDFLFNSRTEIPDDIDLLIVDATYGNPTQTRSSINEISRILKEKLRATNKPIFFFTHQGKIQETMSLLQNNCDIDKPILLSDTSYDIAKIYKKYDRNIGECYKYNSEVGREIHKNKNFIAFIDTSKKPKHNFFIKDSLKISLSGWIFNKPFIKMGKNHYSFSLSAHADFNKLIDYIKSCNPKFVITDNFRFGSAKNLSTYINKKLNIKSIPLPIKNQLQ